MNSRNLLLWLFALVALLVVNGLIIQKENLMANGQVVLLELTRFDPRSLIQGDYMRLRYAITGEVANANGIRDGYVVVRLNENNVAHYARVSDSQTTVAQDEILLHYQQSGNIGPQSFFIQEGHAKYYRGARYAEFRVSADGDISLVGLRGENFEVLGPP